MRLQRWALWLGAYNFKIIYKKGSEMYMADTLSRLTSNQAMPLVATIELQNLCDERIIEKVKTFKCKDLMAVKKYVLQGWPKYLSKRLLPYKRDINEYAIQNGLLYRGIRLVIPKMLRRQCLEILHTGHIGIVRMRRTARQVVWWPNIDKDINAFVNNCDKCKMHGARPTNAHLTAWPECNKPMQRIHLDSGFFERCAFIIMVDSFSGWVNVTLLSALTGTAIIKALRGVFMHFGLPDAVVTDNGSNFTSKEVRNFLSKCEIEHITCPAYHHQSNGLAEKTHRHI